MKKKYTIEKFIDYFVDNDIELTREQVEILYKTILTTVGLVGVAYGGKKLYDYYKKKKLEKEIQGK